MILPPEFTANMQKMFCENAENSENGKNSEKNPQELADFLAAITTNVKYSGLRVNPLKITPPDFVNQFSQIIGDLKLEPVKWCKTGFYYDSAVRPAKNPLYNAGLYYLQEPSAMSAVEILAPQPGEKVLDLCAAPGGKSVQIAGHLQNTGLLVANDASASRNRALVKNLTMCGATNAVILKESPRRLVAAFANFFDKILVDAPCSGEGMFRKDAAAIAAWTANKPNSCAVLQTEILHYAAQMLKIGGKMLYSTCTFNKTENEEQISAFLASHANFAAVDISKMGDISGVIGENFVGAFGFASGFPPLQAAVRLFPHKVKGEGHFLCLLTKVAEDSAKIVVNAESSQKSHKTGKLNKSQKSQKSAKSQDIRNKPPAFFEDFCKINVKTPITGNFTLFGESLFLLPKDTPNLAGLRVASGGLYLGELKKDRFEPSHAMALALQCENVLCGYNLTNETCDRYLKGETLEFDIGNFANGEDFIAKKADKQWLLMCFCGFPVGWGKLVGGRVKNRYPQGWINL
ncbi:MAG: RsmF rRNA methyltransferase first C-terminal domain-containing protein [Defluviitaleaceae bacterium]|nr:RsmF rRNA methyltransferase first C-terminal domain-containing protein [Defluviitaleaceae bacterium]